MIIEQKIAKMLEFGLVFAILFRIVYYYHCIMY